MPEGPNVTLVQFRSLENSMISSSERGRSPRLADIEHVIGTHPFFEGFRELSLQRYWDTFVVDAIIGNFDRHSGNWGYLAEVDPQTRIPTRMLGPAPVYDCGSSMATRLSESEMESIANDPGKLEQQAIAFPNPRLVVHDGKSTNYRDFLLSPEGADARLALTRLAPRIASLDIHGIIASVPGISQTRRDFYEATLFSRIEHVLQPAYDLARQEHAVIASPSTLMNGNLPTTSNPEQPLDAATAYGFDDGGFGDDDAHTGPAVGLPHT